MTRKIIKKLVLASYTNNNLDSKKVDKIAKLLNRQELKAYIKAIKNYEKGKSVTLLTPDSANNKTDVNELKKLFPDKKILLEQDKSLLAGIRIIDNDTIYDFNLKNTLQNLVSYING
jgi:F0F1-type ATP synthase delta subunit